MKFKEFILDIIFPRRCPVCDDVLKFGGGFVCPDCRKKLVYVGEISCRKCGKRLSNADQEFCGDCRNEKHYFNKARSVFVYNDAMRNSILRYKNNGRREYADFYSDAICGSLGREIRSFHPDAVLAVPLSKRTYEKRGFNQAELICEKLEKRLGVKFYKDYLARERDSAQQKALSRAERRKNLKKAFTIRKNDVKLKRVVLLDDVYTTGSTVDEISILLRRSGVRSIMVVCLSSGTPV